MLPDRQHTGGLLASITGLSTAILSATQGSHTVEQPLLDITQGARISASSYSPQLPPQLSLRRAAGGGAIVAGWKAILGRAAQAPQILRPGLLASAAGGAAFVGLGSSPGLDGLLAAGRRGRVATLSLGAAGTLKDRIAAAQRTRRLVVADLPRGSAGISDLRSLVSARRPGELLVVLQRPYATVAGQLLWVSASGFGEGHTLTSQTTAEQGLVASIDIAPTILTHLGLTVPAAMRGAPIEAAGPLHERGLGALMARLNAIAGRRLPALAWLLGATVALALLAPLAGAGAGRRARRAWTLRAGALALLWSPAVSLLTAALQPGAGAEYAILAGSCLGLGALTEAAIAWPRALMAPAIVAIVAIALDAALGTQLLMRSLLGPDPAFGARFHGIGNELKPVLAVLALAAVAAALHPAGRGRKPAIAMALAGALLAIVEGSTLIGAGVGGAILVSSGTAVATALLLPGTITRRRVALTLATPAVALGCLAAIDVATAHGAGQLNGSVLHASSGRELWDIVVRRYGAAWVELGHGTMPYATALALGACVLGVIWRRRLLAPLGSADAVFAAALAGGLTAGVVGALVEDSGPVLLVLATLTLACVLAYLQGKPESVRRRSRGTPRAARSHALRP